MIMSALKQTKATVPGTRVMCPDNCRYRDRLAPFCGYCMMEILNRKKKTEESDGKDKPEADRQAGKERL